jgi:two-component system NarL family sensor kinase
VKTVLFRVAQEALANVAKHAAATRVRLALRFGGAGVSLEVEDDGRGFDVEAVQLDPRRGIGLRNMRERLASIGGRFEVVSAPGAGTRLRGEVPAEAVERFRAG